jgi:3-deoxy-D-manno-octulosonic acid kinase
LKIITKKINNTVIFYDKDIEINIEDLFLSKVFKTNESINVEWINDKRWVKKHYFRKGMMSFMLDNYLYKPLHETRSYKEFSLLNYLYHKNFQTCRPIMGWVDYNLLSYKANLITESIPAVTFDEYLYSIDTSQSHSLLDLKHKVYRSIGMLVSKMHMLGVNHGDLNMTNILINKERISHDNTNDNIWIIDFDKSIKANIIMSKEAKDLNIKRLKRSILKKKLYDEESFNHFLDAYEAYSKD